MPSTQLIHVLRDCVNNTPQGQTFTLYIRGSRHDDWRDLRGYCKPGQTRVIFDEEDVLRFQVRDMQNAMQLLGFDFAQRPVGQGHINSNWLMTPCNDPEKFLYMKGPTSAAIQRREQDERFAQFREFENSFPA